MLAASDLTKRFDGVVAVDDVSLTVEVEIVAILGPSGCGKSTLLRMIAGLETPDAGRVAWNGTDITEVPAHRRNFGLMFQSFALFPHRTVRRNVSFGLEMQRAPRPTITARVDEVLEWVGMGDKAHRRVDDLSGGERQRVALARTLAPEPALVMLDEPLGALDRLMRDRLLTDIRRLLVETSTPAIYVTHDHDEARAVADRVALMRGGRLVQSGTWDELVTSPADPWVTEFLGV